MNMHKKHPGRNYAANGQGNKRGKKLARPGHEVYRDERKPAKKEDTFCLTCGLKNCVKLTRCSRARLEKY